MGAIPQPRQRQHPNAKHRNTEHHYVQPSPDDAMCHLIPVNTRCSVSPFIASIRSG